MERRKREREKEGCARPDHRALSKPLGNHLNGSGGRSFQPRTVWGPAGKVARQSHALSRGGLGPRAQGREDTGNLLAPVASRPPRARPSPLRLPPVQPAQGHARGHQDFSPVLLFWSLPTETDRGQRGRQGSPGAPPAPASGAPFGLSRGATETLPSRPSNQPPGPYPSRHHVNLRVRPATPSDAAQGLPAAAPGLPGGWARRDGGKPRPGGAGRGPGARCRWRRRRPRLLSLQLPLSPAPPPPPPPAFPLGFLRCQERPNRGSASSRSLPGELQPATSAGARPPSRACAPAACPAQALPERSR